MPVIITMTNENISVDGTSQIYDYSKYDRVLKNIHNNEYEVMYSGQNKGLMDNQLIKAIGNNDIFKIYYRNKKNKPFNYLGYTDNVNIIQYRKLPIKENTSINERLQIHLIINNIYNYTIPQNNILGNGKFKKDVLIHSGLRDKQGKSLISHNRNTCLGFYYYL